MVPGLRRGKPVANPLRTSVRGRCAPTWPCQTLRRCHKLQFATGKISYFTRRVQYKAYRTYKRDTNPNACYQRFMDSGDNSPKSDFARKQLEKSRIRSLIFFHERHERLLPSIQYGTQTPSGRTSSDKWRQL